MIATQVFAALMFSLFGAVSIIKALVVMFSGHIRNWAILLLSLIFAGSGGVAGWQLAGLLPPG